MAIKYIYQIAVNIPNELKVYQHFQFPPKFTHIGIFGLKIYHLPTLVWVNYCEFNFSTFFQELEAECAEKSQLQAEVELLAQKLKDEQVDPRFTGAMFSC
jgi:hypothetical protein